MITGIMLVTSLYLFLVALSRFLEQRFPYLTTPPEPATSVPLLSGLVMGGLAKRKLDREKRRASRL